MVREQSWKSMIAAIFADAVDQQISHIAREHIKGNMKIR
jgi:hypothetical protein